MADEDLLIDYEHEETAVAAAGEEKDTKKGHYVGIHTSNFRDFILKPELLRAVIDCGFEHPSEGTYPNINIVYLENQTSLDYSWTIKPFTT